MGIGNNQTMILLDFHLQSTVQFLRLGDVIQQGIIVTLFQGLQRDDLGLNANTEVGIGAFL